MIRVPRSLSLKDWPQADRLGWEAACQPGTRLVRGGAAAHLAPVTQADLANRYGLYLDSLDRCGRLDPGADAGALVTPEGIGPFIAELQARVTSVTVSRTIYKVRRAAECITPNGDFNWLAEIGKDLVLLERPKEDFGRNVSPVRLVEAGLSLMRKGDSDINGAPLCRAIFVRNGLMVALLAACPVRLKNYASLQIGRSFLRLDGGWWIALEETKTGRPDHRPIPEFLPELIESYVSVSRPILLQGSTSRAKVSSESEVNMPSTRASHKSTSALWVGIDGKPLTYNAVGRIITETTRKALGVAVNPHRFRKAAATFAALKAQSLYLGSALLQHADRRMTEEHYIRASSLSVAQDFTNLIANLRRR